MGIVLSGIVIHGDAYGRTLGFPTANLDRRQYSRLKRKPKFGVYAGTAKLPSGKVYQASMLIGPLDKRGQTKIEAHLIGFNGNLYGKRLTYHFAKYLRPFRKFPNESALKRQIEKDIIVTKKLIFIP